MRLDHLQYHNAISRRRLLGGIAAVGAAATVAGNTVLGGVAGAQESHDHYDDEALPAGSVLSTVANYDDLLDLQNAENGNWWKATQDRYGKDDQRGTLNEITPRKTAKALRLLEGAGKVVTHGLGALLVNGTPGYRTFPPRKHEQRLISLGYTPGDPSKWFSTTTTGIAGEDEWRVADRARGPLGYLQGAAGFGTNLLSGHEERFPEGGTFQLATQLDGLAHIGYKSMFYNGNDARQVATPTGMSRLGIEHVGPIVTRGLLIDVLGYKIKTGSGDVQTVNGNKMLSDTYRITVEDLKATMKWEGLKKIEPGDVVLVRTGWNALSHDPTTYDRYLGTEPGIYIREAKFLGDHRPAIIGADSWALELVGVADPNGYAFGVHTELLPKRGIRIGEGIETDALAANGDHEFVYFYVPVNSRGATAGNTPPVALTRG